MRRTNSALTISNGIEDNQAPLELVNQWCSFFYRVSPTAFIKPDGFSTASVSVTPEDELADALEDIARDIALIEPDPRDWAGWVMYFVDQLEEEAKRRRRGFDFNSLMGTMVSEFQDRMKGK